MSEASPTTRQRLRPAAGLATFFIAVVGLLAANLVPLMLIALEAEGFSPTGAGAVMTSNLLATALAALLTMRGVAGSRRLLVGRAGLILAFAGYALAAVVPAGGTFLVLVISAAGLGSGAALSAGGAALASFDGSNRVVGLNVLFNRGLNAVLLALVPAIGLSTLSVFGSVAAVCLISLALVHLLPRAVPQPQDEVRTEPGPAAPLSAGSSGAGPSAAVTVAGVALLACFAVWALSEDALWAIAGTMGAEQAALDDALLGVVLSLSTVGGLAGALLVVVTGARFGRAIPLALMLVLGGALKLGSTLTTDAMLYAILLILWNFIYGIAYTYFVATAAGLDASGRWSGPILGVYLIGSSFAPVFATSVAAGAGYAGFGWVIGAISIALIVPMVLIARLSVREESRTAQSVPAPVGTEGAAS